MKNIVCRYFIIIFISLFNIKPTYSQTPEIKWQKTIGGSNWDKLHSIQQTRDGGYILGGSSLSGISGDKTDACQGHWDYWIVKLDTTGQKIEWQNTIGGDTTDFLSSIQQTSDGGYILGGSSLSGLSGDKTDVCKGRWDYWVVKLDTTGQQIEWQKTIGGSSLDKLRAIQQTTDGGYILGGTSSSGISGDKTETSQGRSDYWVIKLDETGSIIWQSTFGGSHYDYLHSIQQTSDGGYVLGGSSMSGASGDKNEPGFGWDDYWIISLDGNGNIIWQNTIGRSKNDVLQSIQQTSDGGYILGGNTWDGIPGDQRQIAPGDEDYWVIKLDKTGQISEWQNVIGGNNEDRLLSVQQTNDGGYILGGSSISQISGDKTEKGYGWKNYWVIKLDDSGEKIEWQKTIGGNYANEFSSIQQTSDGGYIIGGSSNSEMSGDKTEASKGLYDYWIIKLYSAITH